jgi:hypothetical protein
MDGLMDFVHESVHEGVVCTRVRRYSGIFAPSVANHRTPQHFQRSCHDASSVKILNHNSVCPFLALVRVSKPSRLAALRRNADYLQYSIEYS